MNQERKSFVLDIKNIKDSQSGLISEFEGYSAGLGNEDLGRDLIAPGAFQKTISERVAAGKVKLLDNHMLDSVDRVLGRALEANEEAVDEPKENEPTHKLWTRFSISSDSSTQKIMQKVKEGHLDSLSIGYRPIKVEYASDEGSQEEDPRWAWMFGEGTRTIKELAWYETSIVAFPMNPEATVIETSLKRLDHFASMCKERQEAIPAKYVEAAVKSLSNLIDMDVSPEQMTKAKQTIERLENITKNLNKVEKDVFVQLINEYKKVTETPSKEHFFLWFADQVGTKETQGVILFKEENDSDGVEVDEGSIEASDNKDEEDSEEDGSEVDLADVSNLLGEVVTLLNSFVSSAATTTEESVDEEEKEEAVESTLEEIEEGAADNTSEDEKDDSKDDVESIRIALELAETDLIFN